MEKFIDKNGKIISWCFEDRIDHVDKDGNALEGEWVEGLEEVLDGDGNVITKSEFIIWREEMDKFMEENPDSAEDNLIALRDVRNAFLKESDQEIAPDMPDSLKDSWQNYRQELRDIPSQYSSIKDVVWPTKPG